jgi:hypothetical protein
VQDGTYKHTEKKDFKAKKRSPVKKRKLSTSAKEGASPKKRVAKAGRADSTDADEADLSEMYEVVNSAGPAEVCCPRIRLAHVLQEKIGALATGVEAILRSTALGRSGNAARPLALTLLA